LPVPWRSHAVLFSERRAQGPDLMTQMATMATAMMQMQSQTIAILARHFINKEEQAKGPPRRKPRRPRSPAARNALRNQISSLVK
jgi:hypothetical protein